MTLPRIINQNTVLGIDANCVPDVTIDRRSPAASAYDNTGVMPFAARLQLTRNPKVGDPKNMRSWPVAVQSAVGL